MCCACVNGEYYCTACGSKPGAGGPCAEGAACSQQGATCANSPVSAGGGGGTNTGGADAGAPIDPGSAGGEKPPASGAEPIAPSKTGALSSDGAAAPTCCTCGADGLFHCGGSCPGNTNTGGGADAGMSGGADASTRPSDPGPIGDGKCGQGGVCQPGSAPCSDASPTSCTKCDCGADGHYVCTPCSTGGPADAGVPIDPGAGECVPGGICQPGSAGCGSGSSGGACMKCDCGADGHYKCSPCAGGADAGAPPPPQPIQQCVQGGACSVQGQGCGAGDIGTCMKCMCEADLQLACSPC
jgi:hypothetical protein